MKKLLIIISIALIALVLITVFVFNAIINKGKNQQYIAEKEIIEDECTEEYASMQQNTVTVNNADNKVSPGAKIILQKYYKRCKHTTKTEIAAPLDIVNMTREEVEKEYVDWQVKNFLKDEIVLYKEIDGMCDEHYFITEKNGYLAIYKLDEAENKTLKEVTDISLEYLSEYDLEEIRNGIEVHGEEELNSILEDFE